MKERGPKDGVSLKIENEEVLELIKKEVILNINVTRILGLYDRYRFRGKVERCQVNNSQARKETVNGLLQAIYREHYVAHQYQTSYSDNSENKDFEPEKTSLLKRLFYQKGTMSYRATVYLARTK